MQVGELGSIRGAASMLAPPSTQHLADEYRDSRTSVPQRLSSVDPANPSHLRPSAARGHHRGLSGDLPTDQAAWTEGLGQARRYGGGGGNARCCASVGIQNGQLLPEFNRDYNLPVKRRKERTVNPFASRPLGHTAFLSRPRSHSVDWPELCRAQTV